MKAKASRGRKAVLGGCRLCGVQAQLQHSHVIPKLMFRSMQRFAPGVMPHRTGGGESRPRPGHIKEHMLCSECEGEFSRYERVGGQFLACFNRYRPRPLEEMVQWEELDYANLKLFFLSMLWRCAVTQSPMTPKVDLASRLGRLTELLRGGEPGGEEEYPVLLRFLQAHPIDRNAVMTVPYPMRDRKRRGYSMVGYGVEISWITDRQGVDPRHAPWILKEDGTWLVEVSPGSRSPAWRQAITEADEKDRKTLADPRTRERLKRRILARKAREAEKTQEEG